jgi:hypothetical protein
MGLNLDQPDMEGGATSGDPGGNSQWQPRTGHDYPPQRLKPAPARQARIDLIQIIEGEIIPRLFLAHRDREPHPLAGAGSEAGEGMDSAFLARLFMDGNASEIVNRLQDLLGGGMRRDRLYLDLLAPVPGVLSRLWSEGQCSFDEIAIGLSCVDEVLQEMHAREQTVPESH